jgi:D-mannonate dehydratase
MKLVFVSSSPESMPVELVLIRGLPGSGKSTAAATKFSTYDHHEADTFYMCDGVYTFDPKLIAVAHSFCLANTYLSLARRKDVVVSNTFTTFAEMKAYADLAKALNARLSVYEAFGNFQSIHNVPDHTIERMKNRWESIQSMIDYWK